MQVTKFTLGGSSACFVNNQFDDRDINVTVGGATHLVPAWSVSILPDCKAVAFNSAKACTHLHYFILFIIISRFKFN